MTSEETRKLRAIILKYEGYPDFFTEDTISGFQLLREIAKDVYEGLGKGVKLAAYKEFLYEPMQPSKKAILNLSSSLYGYYDERHVQLRKNEKVKEFFPLFLNIDSLKSFKSNLKDSKGNEYNIFVKLKHAPVPENYWHFEFAVYKGDEKEENRIYPSSKPGSLPEKAAERLIDYITTDNKCLVLLENKRKYVNSKINKILKDNGVKF